MRQITDGALSESVCRAMLASRSVGRLALSVRALPVILPVQYDFDGDFITICLGGNDVPPASVADAVAAFSVDDIQVDISLGWTVHVLGTIGPPRSPGAPTDCGQVPAGPLVQMTPAAITGRRLRLCPFLAGSPLKQ